MLLAHDHHDDHPPMTTLDQDHSAVPPRRHRTTGAVVLVLAWAATIATLLVWLTGGFRQEVLGLRVSASNLDRPLLLAAVLWVVLVYWWPARIPKWTPRSFVVVALILVGGFAATYAAPFAAGADMYGYVAQAADWRAGRLVHAVAPPAPVTFPDHAYVPLGYAWRYPPPSAVAIYPPGTSLHMTVAALATPAAMYVISALAALAAIVGTYRLGVVYFTERTGAWAAVLLAFSPQLLMQALVPMSDTLATAYWVWALVCAGSGRLRLHVLAGVLASIAIAVRPNLAPVFLAVLVCSASAAGLRAAAVSALAALPVLCGLAWHNTVLHGAPLATGYGPTSALFAWAHAPENLRRYGTWLAQTVTPIPVLGVAASLVRLLRHREQGHAGLMLFVGIVALLYLWYLPWPNWTFSRFLLPALPAAFLLTVSVVRALMPAVPALAFATLVAVLGWQMHFVQESEIRQVRVAMSRFAALGDHFRGQPPRGTVITRVHSGSLRYYASATTVRWDQLSVDQLRTGIERERAAGRQPLLIDDADDRTDFEARFGPVACWGDTDAPVLVMQRHAEVRVLLATTGCQQP